MKKTTIFCDDCASKISESEKQILADAMPFGQDICNHCFRARVRQSIKDYPIGSLTCKMCKNTKKVRVRTGYNDEYEMRPEYSTIECQACKDGIKLEK